MEKLTSLALAISLFAGVYDWLTQRIPNWLTAPAVILGLGAHFFYAGWHGFFDGILGIFAGFAFFAPMYFLKWMGAGDVKLLMAIGALTSWIFCAYVAIASIFVGAAYALFDTIRVGRFFLFIRSIARFLMSLFIPDMVVEKPKLSDRKFSFGMAIAVAVGVVIFLQNQGRIQ